MRLNLILKSLIIFLLTALMAGNASASIVWTGQTGSWTNSALWDKGFVPNGTEDIKLTKPGTL
jgi:ACR3 family arsenite efflux pump ArsB